MTQSTKQRLWMKIKTKSLGNAEKRLGRLITDGDIENLAALMDRAYQGTIDHEGESLSECVQEIEGTLHGKYGPFLSFASFLIEADGKAVSASIITEYKGKPLIAFTMTDPSHQGKGFGSGLISQSIDALAKQGHQELFLVVTDGNVAAQSVYTKLGFVTLGQALPQQPPPTESP